MAIQIQFRRGSTSAHALFTGAEGEVTVDTSKDTLVVHDGVTQGGFPLAKASDLAPYITQASATGTFLTQSQADTLYIGQAVSSISNTLDMQNNKIINVANPTEDHDVATKAYVDIAVQGIQYLQEVQVATITDIELSGLQIIDGYTTLLNDRVLVKNQNNQTQNGIYVAEAGAWARSADADNVPSAEFGYGTAAFVVNGTANGSTTWIVVQPETFPVVFGTDNIQFSQIAGATNYNTGTGIQITGNTIAVTDSVILTSGNQTIAGVKTLSNQLLLSTGSAGTPSLSWSIDPDTGLYHTSTNLIAFSIGGSAVALMEGRGTSTTDATTLITREKGDARYLQTTGDVQVDGTLQVTGNTIRLSGTAPALAYYETDTVIPGSFYYETLGSNQYRHLYNNGVSAKNIYLAPLTTSGASSHTFYVNDQAVGTIIAPTDTANDNTILTKGRADDLYVSSTVGVSDARLFGAGALSGSTISAGIGVNGGKLITIFNKASIATTSSNFLQIRFSNNNGASYGAFQNIGQMATGASGNIVITDMTIGIDLVANYSYCVAHSTSWIDNATPAQIQNLPLFGGNLTIPAGVNAFQLRQSNNAGNSNFISTQA